MINKDDYIARFGLTKIFPPFIIESMHLCRFKKGDYLCRRDDPIVRLSFLVEGKLQIESVTENGKLSVISFETPLAVVGEIEVIMEEQTMRADIKAVEESYVFSLTEEALQRGMRDVNFLCFLNRSLAAKLIFNGSMLMYSTSSLRRRLVRYILLRSEKEGRTLTLEKRESVAALLGVTVRHLNRTLQQLADTGAISIQGRSLRIDNRQLLKGNSKENT